MIHTQTRQPKPQYVGNRYPHPFLFPDTSLLFLPPLCLSLPLLPILFHCNYKKQSRTYLFCAIRPEVKYHSYTFSTCNFAKNASVVKLQPKKAVAASSPAERKLMEELEQMKVRTLRPPPLSASFV